MAIARKNLVECKNVLKGRTSIVDTFLFFAIMIQASPMIFDSRELSLYRVHGGNDSYFNPRDSESERFLRRLNTVRNSYEELREFVFRKNSGGVLAKVSQLLFVSKILQGLQFNFNRKFFLNALRMMKSDGGFKYALSRKDTLIFCIAYLISQRLGLYLYYMRYPERKKVVKAS